MSNLPTINLDAEIRGRKCATQLVGAWCIEEQTFNSLWSFVQSLDINQVIRDNASLMDTFEGGEQLYQTQNGVAVVTMHGPITKQAHSLQAMLGGASTVKAREAIQEAMNDKAVKAVLLHIDSPGGSVAGTGDFADFIARAKSQKPIYAYIEDLGASAAYWIASQATAIYASRHSNVGSIGTFAVIYDQSEAYERAGVKAHVIKAGKHKGDFAAGTKVTDEQLAKYQRHIDQVNALFLSGVSSGRGLAAEDVQKLNTGEVWLAEKAAELGLVDKVMAFEDAFADIVASLGGSRKMSTIRSNTSAMAEELFTNTLSAGWKVGDSSVSSGLTGVTSWTSAIGAVDTAPSNDPPVDTSRDRLTAVEESTTMTNPENPDMEFEVVDKGEEGPAAEAGSVPTDVKRDAPAATVTVDAKALSAMQSELDALKSFVNSQKEMSERSVVHALAKRREEIAAEYGTSMQVLEAFTTSEQLDAFEAELARAHSFDIPKVGMDAFADRAEDKDEQSRQKWLRNIRSMHGFPEED